MPYLIELMSIGKDQYPLLEGAAKALNAVQKEFHFRLTSQSQRQSGLSFERKAYSTAEIWSFLRGHRDKSGGNRPYIIAFVSAPLASSNYSNLFGSHEAKEGLAVVTLDGCTQYVTEAKRYCCYYLVRYSLSFVNPLIKAHTEEARKDCYFHKKLFKPDIRASMDSGNICDECLKTLENPSDREASNPLSADEYEALRRMRDVVSGDFPYALIMKGGGVKGLAFAGALLELEKYFWFDVHAGTSAGAISAVLLAANYSPGELRDLLIAKNFREFKDASIFRIPLNLLLKRACFPGLHFQSWITDLLKAKINRLSELKMSNLPNGAVVYACQTGSGTITFDSRGERKDASAAFAARCSMSIPIFFFPQELDGQRVYDGGLRHIFPVTRFLTAHPDKPFIGLYLGSPNSQGKPWIWSELIDIWIEGESRGVVDSHSDSIVVIDTSPIGTVDFRLRENEKELLLKVGKAAALRFLQSRSLDDGPDQDAVETAYQEAEDCRRIVIRMRRSRRLRVAIAVGILIVAGFGLIKFFGLFGVLFS